jgi:uncharacterized protein
VSVLRALVLLLAVLAAAGCGGGGDPGADAAPSAGTVEEWPELPENALPLSRAAIERRSGGTVELTVELARTAEERATGLMGRESLPPRHGMLFVFPEASEAGFWMKDTLIPLSIAFIAEHGEILEILDMEPCRADPCPGYDPGVTYRRALEVNQGAFERWGVSEGDLVRLEREP